MKPGLNSLISSGRYTVVTGKGPRLTTNERDRQLILFVALQAQTMPPTVAVTWQLSDKKAGVSDVSLPD
ncbi:hypothetical protein [Brevibacterium aurantiacum]|uniref:hypothetical protein n=1 Tax=Brevibacterium aurantiacum TaxID=273384 RepID=UPI000FCB05E0|nr:hypothetical protein [Brevibacterium aurantiacum]